MKLRTKFYPKTLMDALSFTFVLIIIPVMYWFELFVVLPTVYPPGSLWHSFHFICGSIVMINVTGNFVTTVLCDTSLDQRDLPSNNPTGILPGWHYCKLCERTAPPRSWHCEICRTCILKREHHCPFTGCCIGHNNHRYYLIFVMHLFIATFYATVFNNAFIWEHFTWGPAAIMKILFPFASLVYGFEATASTLYVFLYIVNVAGLFFSGALLYIHGTILFNGIVSYEKKHSIKDYDFGVRQNVKELLGEKWYLVWFYPFVQSKLPRSGMSWEALKSDEKETNKDKLKSYFQDLRNLFNEKNPDPKLQSVLQGKTN